MRQEITRIAEAVLGVGSVASVLLEQRRNADEQDVLWIDVIYRQPGVMSASKSQNIIDAIWLLPDLGDRLPVVSFTTEEDNRLEAAE